MPDTASLLADAPDQADTLAWPLLGQLLDAWAQQQGALWAIKDARDGRYVAVSAGMAALLAKPVAQVSGLTDADLLEPALATALRAADQTAVAALRAVASEHRFEWRGVRQEFSVWRQASLQGQRLLLASLWLDQSAARQRDAQLRSAQAQLEQQQKEQLALRQELRDQGLRDQQTGLYTLTHFDDQLRRELDLSSREHREFALVYMHLDPFGPKVRALAPRAQECILEALGRLLRGNTRAMDASCRMNEHRFAVLLSGVGLATAHSRMEGLRRQCATQMVMLDGQELNFTVSMGLASYPHTAQSREDVVGACESALSEAQRRGGNAIALASIRFETQA